MKLQISRNLFLRMSWRIVVIKGTNKKSLGPVAITQLCQMMNIESVYKEQDLDFAVCSFQ